MARLPAITFSKLEAPREGAVAMLVAKDGGPGRIAAALDPDKRLARAIKVSEFTGKLASEFEVLAPSDAFQRFVVVGVGDLTEAGEKEWLRVGGRIRSHTQKAAVTTILCETGSGPLPPEAVAAIAGGAKLRAYDFDAYRTKDTERLPETRVVLACADPAAARKAWREMDGVSDGVMFARDLVNEPANILGPVEFAERLRALETDGVTVEVLEEQAMRELGMGALLGVAQGSVRPPRLVVMQWNGGAKGEAPAVFVGKGVVFDTGGISIKPSAGMEDMKGDKGGAAAVCGLMKALATRHAKANVIGIVGLVENMPDGNAQRPGDIVRTMSGQTVEVLNTDAEGRLVLADALWYAQDRFAPRYMVDLATLTGAILVALGHNHAGLFCNDDPLAGQITAAGLATEEKVWRMPLGPDYDKMLESKNADMKNIGGRLAGAITAAQFLQRFVNGKPWAHLDIAGTAMGSPKSDYSQGWASGFGVRLLNRLVADSCENG